MDERITSTMRNMTKFPDYYITALSCTQLYLLRELCKECAKEF